MIVTITVLVLLLSLIGIFVLRADLFYKYGWFEEMRFFLGRIFLCLFGIGVLFLGISFFQMSWFMSAFFGTLFFVWGIQIALWGIGISLDFLGNVPTIPTNLNIMSSRSDYVYQSNQNWDVLRSICNPLGNRLQIAIGILKYSDENKHSDNSEEVLKAFRAEIEQILKTVIDNPDLMSGRGLGESIAEFMHYSPVFRFAPLYVVTKELPLLEKLEYYLQHPEYTGDFYSGSRNRATLDAEARTK
jgi:hypothetical protein